MIVDNDLELDKKAKRYYLTENYVYNDLGTDLSLIQFDEFDTNISTATKRNIKYACDMVYDYIDENAFDKTSTYYAFLEDEDVHRAIKEALGLQLYYFILNGDVSNDVGNKSALTISSRVVQKLNGAGVFHIVADVPDGWCIC